MISLNISYNFNFFYKTHNAHSYCKQVMRTNFNKGIAGFCVEDLKSASLTVASPDSTMFSLTNFYLLIQPKINTNATTYCG